MYNPVDGAVDAKKAYEAGTRSHLRTQSATDNKNSKQWEREERKKEQRRREIEAGMELVQGREHSPVTRLEKVWLSEFRAVFPDVPAASKWGIKQRSQVKLVLDLYDPDRVEEAIVFLFRNWKSIHAKFFKSEGSPVPGVGVLLACHGTLVPSAAVWAKHRQTLEEYEAFAPGDPDARRPSELRQRYQEARGELAALGLAEAS